MKSYAVAPLLIFVSLGLASPAFAQNDSPPWYAGVGVGRLNTDFRPYYTYDAGGTPDEYHNEAHGLDVEFVAGRRVHNSKRWSLSLQASAGINTFKWSLDIPAEPAALEYSLPYRMAVSLVPELHLGRVSVFADIGGGMGRVHQMKTTPDARVSRYDYDELRPTLNLGGGVTVRASRRLDLFAHVGHARHFGVEFDSFSNMTGMLPVVSKVEHVKDSPRATGFRVGLITRF